ncbi:MAG TPA: (Fe-S)-binding protein, partial [Ilumatobacteraceae bacterium]|nr:(Fe-S)-binding protein [Ilumatobacteraceae bacterium]
MKLRLDDDELSMCVACGLCLPHCPTFRVTGEEGLSPRGRIAAMRTVHFDAAPITDDFVHFMETCVQCRGCEPACPSGVPFGRLMEGTRDTLAEQHRMTPWWQRAGYRVLGHHRVLLLGSTMLAAAQRLHLVPKRLGLPQLAVKRGPTPTSTGNDAWLFTGCVMDAWQRDTHRNTAKVLTAVGVGYRTPEAGGDCCGALHIHAGLTDEARGLAERVMRSMPGDAPIVVNSAGCGAALKDYGHLVDTDEARRFSARVRDVNEFVAPLIDALPVRRRVGTVAVQDPCHLRHVQRAHLPVRT